ncbi:sporulation protein [Microbacteriaceae bacterium 4G12]
MKARTIIGSLIVISALLGGCSKASETADSKGYDQVVELPADKYPETAAHIKNAIAKGKTDMCTIDRKGAKDRRKQSLAHIPTKKGYDRDEFPMAFCKEGGSGADIEYISPEDNRGAGSYIGNKVENLKDGTRVKIAVK